MAESTRVSAPWRSSASCTASELRTVASISDVVAGRAVHALRRGRHPAVDVSAPDHERNLEPGFAHLHELARQLIDGPGIKAVLRRAHQGLTGQLEQDPLEHGRMIQLWNRSGHVSYATAYQA